MVKVRVKTGVLAILVFVLALFSIQSYGQKVPHLSMVGHWDGHSGNEPYNSLWGWSGNGREYAILGSLDSIYFIDITDAPHAKVCDARAGRFDNCRNREFKTYKNYCYAVADQGEGSLQIFDLKYLPDSVHKVYDSDTLSEGAHNAFVDHDRLYLAYNKKLNPKNNQISVSAMTIASLQNPEAPSFISDLKPGYKNIGGNKIYDFEYVHDMFVRNDTAYCSVGEGGLYTYNFKNPEHPVLINNFFSDNAGSSIFNHSCWLSDDGNVLVNTIETARQPVNAFNTTNLKDSANSYKDLEKYCTFDSHAAYGSIAHNAFIKGKFVYLSYYEDGVVVFDMSEPDKVKEIASYDTYPQNIEGKYSGYHGCWNVYPFFESGAIIASDMSNGLFILKMDSVSAIDSRYISDNGLQIKIMGNPFHDQLNLVEDALKDENVNISISDMLGRVLYSKDYQFVPGRNTIEIPLSGIGNGAYLLTIQSGSGIFTRKLVRD